MTTRPNTALEPTPVTPGSFRFGFLVGGSRWRRGSAFGRWAALRARVLLRWMPIRAPFPRRQRGRSLRRRSGRGSPGLRLRSGVLFAIRQLRLCRAHQCSSLFA